METMNSIPTFRLKNGEFTFWAAHYWHKECAVFCVPKGENPVDCAKERGICNYDRLMPSRSPEIDNWIANHPSYREEVV